MRDNKAKSFLVVATLLVVLVVAVVLAIMFAPMKMDKIVKAKDIKYIEYRIISNETDENGLHKLEYRAFTEEETLDFIGALHSEKAQKSYAPEKNSKSIIAGGVKITYTDMSYIVLTPWESILYSSKGEKLSRIRFKLSKIETSKIYSYTIKTYNESLPK